MSQTDSNSQGQKARTSGVAVASMILAGLSFFPGFFLPPIGVIFAIAALICGIVALIQIRRSRGSLEGVGLAASGIATAVCCLVLIVFLVNLIFYVNRAKRRMICESRLTYLGEAIRMYSNEFDGKYPSADKWCDLLHNRQTRSYSFQCPSAEYAGRWSQSHYAMNPHCEPNSLADTVLLFETNGGWNQFGGPEILTTENHNGKGCNILFNDGSVKFVRTDQLGESKWKAEQKK